MKNRSQLDYLRSLGCQEVQGFYFGRAEPAHRVFERIYVENHSKAG